MVFMTDSTDHISGKPGLTLAIVSSKDGGAFGSTSPTVTERANGWYSLALTTGDTDTLGDLAFHVTGTGADPCDFICRVIAVDLADSVRAGMTALPAAIPGQANGMFIAGTNAATTVTTSFTTTFTGSLTGSVGSVAGNVAGNVVGSVGSVATNVGVNLTQTLSAARDVSVVNDTSLTLNDALHCAIAAAAGQETVIGTVYTVKSPTGTTVRVFTLNSGVTPTQRT